MAAIPGGSTLGIIMACALMLGGCMTDRGPPITRPDNRIQQFLGNERFHMTSREKYQEFIERELGAGFTEQDFVAYMEANEADCARDPVNQIMYCRYVKFAIVPQGFDISKRQNSANTYCFWAMPPSDRPTVNFHQADADTVSEFPADRREFARSRPGCRQLLLRFHGWDR